VPDTLAITARVAAANSKTRFLDMIVSPGRTRQANPAG
jgi:hypothetical protein